MLTLCISRLRFLNEASQGSALKDEPHPSTTQSDYKKRQLFKHSIEDFRVTNLNYMMHLEQRQIQAYFPVHRETTDSRFITLSI